MATQLTISSKVKLNNGVEMPRFGLGMFVRNADAPPGEAEGAAAYALSKAHYTLLDTAEYYKNEADAGKAIRKSGVDRASVFVTTKIFTTAGGKEAAIKTIENSLAAMNIGYIDQYLLHAPQGGHVIECYDVLLDYQKRGLIKSVGVSNFGVPHLEALKASGRPLPQVDQIQLHPWYPNEDIVAWCRANGVQVVGYAPLARDPAKLKVPLVVELAAKYKKTTAQILIRWALQNNFVTIPKSTNPKRIDENANVFDFEMSDEDVKALSDHEKENEESVAWAGGLHPTTLAMSEFGPTQ